MLSEVYNSIVNSLLVWPYFCLMVQPKQTENIVLEYWLILTSNIKIKQEMNDEELDEENVITSLNLHIF